MNKFLGLLLIIAALAINSCTDSPVDSPSTNFEGIVYYNAANAGTVRRVNSNGIKEILSLARVTDSPVGNSFMFLKIGAEGDNALVTTDADGGNLKEIDRPIGIFTNLSPTGSKAAYVAQDSLNSNLYNLYTINLDGTEKRNIANNIAQKKIVFSPNGDKIAFFKGEALFIINIDGSDPRFLANYADDGSLDWSPDGQKIVYTHNYLSDKIFVITVGSGAMQELSTDIKSEQNAKWMPDSKNLIYAYGPPLTSENFTESEIQMLDITTGSKKTLVKSANHLNFPQVSPDGKYILYSEIPVGKYYVEGSLKILNLTTSQSIKIADDAYNGFWKK